VQAVWAPPGVRHADSRNVVPIDAEAVVHDGEVVGLVVDAVTATMSKAEVVTQFVHDCDCLLVIGGGTVSYKESPTSAHVEEQQLSWYSGGLSCNVACASPVDRYCIVIDGGQPTCILRPVGEDLVIIWSLNGLAAFGDRVLEAVGVLPGQPWSSLDM